MEALLYPGEGIMHINEGDFLYHNELGVGQVLTIFPGPEPELEIQYKNQKIIRQTTFQLTRNTANISVTGFRVQEFLNPVLAHKMIKEKPIDVIIAVLKDFKSYKARTDQIKTYLMPYIPNWESWWKKTQLLLKDDPRVDTTRSKRQEYSLAREIHSKAEEAYISFRSNKQLSKPTGKLVEYALAALVQNQKGESLPQEHQQDLKDFLYSIIYSDKNDLSLRFNVLFHLQEENLIKPEDGQRLFSRLLEKDFHLYELDLYSSRRIISILMQMELDFRRLSLLEESICVQNETLIKQLSQWVMKQGDSESIKNMLNHALSKNLPPYEKEIDYVPFKIRLVECKNLLKSLTKNDLEKSGYFNFSKIVNQSIYSIPNQQIREFLLPAYLDFVFDLEKRTDESNKLHIYAVLTDPTHNIEYILLILNTLKKINNTDNMVNNIDEYLLNHHEKRSDDFFQPFIESKWKKKSEQVKEIINLIDQYKSPYLIEKGGNLICNIVKDEKEDNLNLFLPALDYLNRLEGAWSWNKTVEGLREKGLYKLLTEANLKQESYDIAYINAANQYLKSKLNEKNQQLQKYQIEIDALSVEIQKKISLLEEKEIVMKELRSMTGGNTEEARFMERVNIIKDFVNSLAEFERFFAGRLDIPQETRSIIKRLENIISKFKVQATGNIGEVVVFNPQIHRLIKPDEIKEGDNVTIIERGFLILDNANQPKPLKQALVEKKK